MWSRSRLYSNRDIGEKDFSIIIWSKPTHVLPLPLKNGANIFLKSELSLRFTWCFYRFNNLLGQTWQKNLKKCTEMVLNFGHLFDYSVIGQISTFLTNQHFRSLLWFLNFRINKVNIGFSHFLVWFGDSWELSNI